MSRLLLLFILFSPFFSPAQHLFFRNYSLKDGLPQSEVYSLAEDSLGRIITGTNGGGVSRFNGHHFEPLGLRGKSIRSLLFDQKGILWAATDHGIFRYINEAFVPVLNDSVNSQIFAISLLQDKTGNIYAGTTSGIYHFGHDGKLIRHLHEGNGLPNNYVFCLGQADSVLVAGTFGGGICLIGTGNFGLIGQFTSANGLPSDKVISMLNSGTQWWFGTYDSGAFSAEITHSKISSGNQILQGSSVWDISQKGSETCFATGNEGLGITGKGETTLLSSKDGLPGDQLMSILESSDGLLWIGTNGKGLVRFSNDKFVHYNKNSGFSKQVYAIAGHGQTMVLGTDKGLFYLDKSSTVRKGEVDELVTSLAFTQSGELWAGTRSEGVFKISADGEITRYSENDGLAANNINHILTDEKGTVWFSTIAGISYYDGKQFYSASENTGLVNNEVQQMAFDSKGNIWIATLGGLMSFNPESGTFTNHRIDEEISSPSIQSLFIQEEKYLWVSADGGELYRKTLTDEKSGFIKASVRSDLIHVISGITGDKNSLVLATDKGIAILKTEEGKIVKQEMLDAEDGFISVENNQNAVAWIDQKVYFGTVDGLTVFQPGVKDVQLPLKVNITTLSVNDENTTGNTFRYDQNEIRFRFESIFLRNPEKVLYSYRLKPLSSNWSDPAKANEITFPSLPPGEYSFEVIAQLPDGIESDPAAFNFTIKPPFWQTAGFYFVVILTAGILIAVFIKVRERKLRKEKDQLEKTVAERTSHLQLANQEISVQKKIIEERNKDIIDSIVYAQRIQNVILPSEQKIRQMHEDTFVFFLPRDIVSGDFYWIAEHEEHLIFIVADCTGHGVPGSLMSMIGNNALNYAVKEKGATSPAEILDIVNAFVKESLRQNHEQEIRDGMDMAVCRLNRNTGELAFAGANNPCYLLSQDNLLPVAAMEKETSMRKLFEIKGDKQPIGNYEYESAFTEKTVTLKKGDMVYIFSDGYADQFGGTLGKKFKYSQFKELLLSLSEKPAEEQAEALKEAFHSWKNGNGKPAESYDQVDDVCVMGLRF